MVFREPGRGPTQPGHVVHGPFPARLGLVGASFAALFVGTVLVLVGLISQRLRCDDALCTIDDEAPFPRSTLLGAHSVVETGSKNSKHGVVVLELANGRERRLMDVEPDEAEDAAKEIRAGGLIDVKLHGARILVPFGFVAFGLAFVMMGIAISKMGRIDLFVENDTLRIRRSVLGIPAGTRVVPLGRIERVIVERGSIIPFMQQRDEAPITAARLRLSGSNERALTRGFYPGHALHLRAAAALRTALSIDPDLADDAELAAMPMVTSTGAERGMYAWMGACTGALLGLAVFGLSCIALGFMTFRSNLEGWVVAGGTIPGAICGIAIAIHATRTRLPR